MERGKYIAVRSPVAQHISHAVLMLRYSDRKQGGANNPIGPSEAPFAISCIIHSYAAFESQLNRIGYETFKIEPSSEYVDSTKRGVLLGQLVRNWHTATALKKFSALADLRMRRAPSERLLDEMRELNTLRNWLVHGRAYETSAILERKDGIEDELQLVSMTDSVSWDDKFPVTGFSAPEQIGFKDARKAFYIVLQAMELLSKELMFFVTEPKPKFKLLPAGDFQVRKLINELLQ